MRQQLGYNIDIQCQQIPDRMGVVCADVSGSMAGDPMAAAKFKADVAFEMFSIMQDSMHYNFISLLYRIDYNTTFSKKEKTENLNYNRSDADKKSNTKNNKNKDKRNRKQRKKKRK